MMEVEAPVSQNLTKVV
jgi:26S proteasome regulatory subunit T3